jgi:AcrR family transcriptional regulator
MVREPASLDVHQLGDRHPGGRPLDASRDDVLRQAALELLAQVGYERLTMDAVALWAGAGKATLYRRWSNKAELVLDALTCEKHLVPSPDTGTLRGDLEALFNRGAAKKNAFETNIMIGLVSALPHDDELRDAIQARLIGPLESTLAGIFERAVQRREIEPVKNLDLVVSVLPALVLYQHLLVGGALEQSLFTSIVEDLFLPLVRYVPTSIGIGENSVKYHDQKGPHVQH